MAAQRLWRAKNYLGDCFRRWKARLGTAKAITAMAHKLARILWHMIRFNQPYAPSVWAAAEEKLKKNSNASNKPPPPSATNLFAPQPLRRLVSQEAFTLRSW